MLGNLLSSLSFLLFVMSCAYTLDEIVVSKYADQMICNAQDMIAKGCFKQEPKARSRIDCSFICSLNPTCSSVLIYSLHQTCYLGESCNFNSLCSQTDQDFKYLVKTTTEASVSTSYPSVETSTVREVEQSTQLTEASPTTPTAEEPTIMRTSEPHTTTQTTEPRTTTQTTESSNAGNVQITGCQNGGIPYSFRDFCNCTRTGGYVGEQCERAATSCTELYKYSYDRGSHALNIDLFGDGSVYYRTTCHLKKWYSTQVSFDIMRSTGSFDTALSYKEYVSGFRFGPNDFWIGLENLHKYTADGRNHIIRLTVNFNSSDVQGELAISHQKFVVAPASLGYRYTLDSSSQRGNTLSGEDGSDDTDDTGRRDGLWLDDVLLSQANIPFSTADYDQDESNTRNCAKLAQAGWWFGDCLPFIANPFGWSYTARPGSPTDQHFYIAGLDMSRSNVRGSVRYVYITLDYP